METIVKLDEQLLKEDVNSDDAQSAKRLLQALGKCKVSTDILRDTRVGKTVQKWKTHPTLGVTAKNLLRQWKRIVEEEEATKRTTVETTCTEVVNVKVKYIRPHYDNLQNIWANPFKITKDSTRTDVLRQYETHLREQLRKDPSLKAKLLTLEGKRLGCWCHPEACHGHVLARAIQEINTGTGDW